MRTLAIAVLVLGAACAYGHPASAEFPEHQDECIDPTRESMGWRFVEGIAVKVEGGQTFVLRDAQGRSIHIDLVGLEIGDDGVAARKLLAHLIQGKFVSVNYNPRFSKNNRILGEVEARDDYRDVSRLLLQAGVVRYKEPPAYSVSDYSSCLYRIAEREAKQAGLGLWKSGARWRGNLLCDKGKFSETKEGSLRQKKVLCDKRRFSAAEKVLSAELTFSGPIQSSQRRINVLCDK
jgi:endonuclease YncB( thermonuclease family)